MKFKLFESRLSCNRRLSAPVGIWKAAGTLFSIIFYIIIHIFLYFIFLCPDIVFSNELYKPVYKPVLVVTKTDGKIRIDGDLNDPGWMGAAKAVNFAEHFPGDQTKPSVETVAMMTYDYENLYVAFICQDDPASIRASYSDHDVMGNDDNICFLLDTFGDALWAYEFNLNPYGVQGEYLWSSNGQEDASFDAVWEGTGRITDTGYQVEMAIPFSSIRFPDKKEQVWKVDFWRNHPRDVRRKYSWAAYDRNDPCWPCQWGIVTGIRDVKPGKGIEFLPSIIGFQTSMLDNYSDPNSNWIQEDPDGELSLGIKYALSSSMTAEAAYNPDFSQIESDVAQIDVNTTFALFYPERRPFFQEGSDLFNTSIKAVYTRSINDPVFAFKTISRFDRFSIAYLAAVDKNSPIIIPLRERSGFALGGESVSNIFRFRYAFGESSSLGLLLTDRRFSGSAGAGTVTGFDGSVWFFNNLNLHAQFLANYTVEPSDTSLIDSRDIGQQFFDDGKHTVVFDGESFWGHNLKTSLSRNGRYWGLECLYEEKSPGFRADNGFVTDNDTRLLEINYWSSRIKEKGFIKEIDPRFGVGQAWIYSEGSRKDRWVWAELGFNTIGQTYLELSGMASEENFGGIQFNGIRRGTIYLESQFSDPVFAGFKATYGNLIARTEEPPVMGRESDLSLWMEFKPTDRTKITPLYNYFRNQDRNTGILLHEGYIMRVKLNYQFTHEFLSRLIIQYNDFSKHWEIDPLLTYRLNPFTVFYLGSTHDIRNYDHTEFKEYERQLFFKFQYLFRI